MSSAKQVLIQTGWGLVGLNRKSRIKNILRSSGFEQKALTFQFRYKTDLKVCAAPRQLDTFLMCKRRSVMDEEGWHAAASLVRFVSLCMNLKQRSCDLHHVTACMVSSPEWKASGVSCAWLRRSCTRWDAVGRWYPPGTCCRRRPPWDWGGRRGAADYWCSTHSATKARAPVKRVWLNDTVLRHSASPAPIASSHEVSLCRVHLNVFCSAFLKLLSGTELT